MSDNTQDTPTPTQNVLTELREEAAQATRAAALANAILTEFRGDGWFTIKVYVPPNRRAEWPTTVTHPDGTVKELTMRRAGVE